MKRRETPDVARGGRPELPVLGAKPRCLWLSQNVRPVRAAGCGQCDAVHGFQGGVVGFFRKVSAWRRSRTGRPAGEVFAEEAELRRAVPAPPICFADL